MHEHVQVELKESGFYPEKLGLELVKSAQKTLGAASVQEGVCTSCPHGEKIPFWLKFVAQNAARSAVVATPAYRP